LSWTPTNNFFSKVVIYLPQSAINAAITPLNTHQRGKNIAKHEQRNSILPDFRSVFRLELCFFSRSFYFIRTYIENIIRKRFLLRKVSGQSQNEAKELPWEAFAMASRGDNI
jgi:hypothetical protein